MPVRTFTTGQRVWYTPQIPGYGYDGAIPAVVVRHTRARVTIEVVPTNGDPVRCIHVHPLNLRPRDDE